MKKSYISAIGIILVVVFLTTCLLACTNDEEKWDGKSLQSHAKGAVYDYTYYKENVRHDKAMILIPGLMASSFYSAETDEPMWSVEGFAHLVTTMLQQPTQEDKSDYFDFVINSLKCDENNIPLMKERIATMQDGEQYATFDGMKYIYDMVYPVYGDRYDVVVWQYDWRQHNMGSAEELEKFIDYNGWDEVMFFTHSMGGVVTANYLARSAENRNKTKLFMPFGCPFFGSMDAINNLFEEDNPSGMMNTLFSAVSTYAQRDFALVDVARTMASIYELLNSPAFDSAWYFDEDSPYYIGASGSIYSDGKYLDNAEIYDLICAFDWAKRTDGTLTPAVNNLPDYWSNLYVDDGNGNKIFVSDAVPTEYIVGIDVETTISVEINAEGKIIGKITSSYGDGTVPAYSASAGHSLDDSNVHLVYGVNHGPLANDNFQASAEESGLQYLMGILARYIS